MMHPSLRGRRWFFLPVALGWTIWLLVVVAAGKFLQRIDPRVDLSGNDIAALSSSTKDALSAAATPLSFTYFTTDADSMPSHMKGMERDVRRLLDAFRREAPGRVDYRVLDPDIGGDAGSRYAAARGVSPFSERAVQQDENTAQTVWSSLVVSREAQPDLLIQGIVPGDLPYLEPLIGAHLNAGETPGEPVFAVSAPGSFSMLHSLLAPLGRVVPVDLDRQARIPPEADVLFWIQPSAVTDLHVRELRRFVASGRSAVLAGSPYAVAFERSDGIHYRIRPMPEGWTKLLASMGLTPQSDLLMDESTAPMAWVDRDGEAYEIQAPFHLRCTPAYRDHKSMASPARGELLFPSAGALVADPLRVKAAGFRAEILATTTEKARAAPLPQGAFDETDLLQHVAVGKQNLAVLLAPTGKWEGRVLVLASAGMLSNDLLVQTQHAHSRSTRQFLQTIVRSFADPRQIVRARVKRPGPPAFDVPDATQRLLWRGAVIVLIPAALLAAVLLPMVAGSGSFKLSPAVLRLRTALGAACCLGVLLASAQVWRSEGSIYLDLTADRANTIASMTRRVVDGCGEALRADLILSSPSMLPAAMKPIETQVPGWLGELGISVRIVRPETASADQMGALLDLGVRPLQASVIRGDATRSQHVWGALQLHTEGAVTAVPRLDTRSLEHFEFLLVAAIHRLTSGRRPHIGLVSESPRLSPTEAYEDYMEKGLSAPRGPDVYSDAKDLLADYGYRASVVDRREPVFPDDMDLLLWLQPRRDSAALIRRLSDFLASGGKAIVALQHFNIQQRQYRGTGFKTVYWPQPQFQDLDTYVNSFGVSQVREVLMDRTWSRLSLDTQVNRAGRREHEDQEVALPFLIRATAESFDPGSPITRNLGDLLFVWGNRFTIDGARLSEMRIRAHTLVTTSSRAWAYDWRGGWLPEEALQQQALLPGPQPLALLPEGRFPLHDPENAAASGPGTLLEDGQDLGKLLLIGCSEMFKNDHLYAQGFDHDQFLLNAVADMVYGPDMAGLQSARKAARGFSPQTSEARLTWRSAVVGGGPVLLFLYGLFRYARRHKGVVA